MLEARRFAAPHVTVTLAAVQAAGDSVFLPGGFERLPDLDRDVTDVATFATSRPFPLLADLLERAIAAADAAGAEFIVFTNTDIALQPAFYRYVDDLLDHGFDALIINRRTLSANHNSVADLTRAWAEGGAAHPGRDCFVFRVDAARRYVVGLACVGAVGVGTTLAINLACYSERLEWVKHAHMTLHWGDDRAWEGADRDEYGEYNLRTTLEVYRAMPPARHHRLAQLGPIVAQLERGWLNGHPTQSARGKIARKAARVRRVTTRLGKQLRRELGLGLKGRPPRRADAQVGPVHGIRSLARVRPDDVFISAFPGSGAEDLGRLLALLIDGGASSDVDPGDLRLRGEVLLAPEHVPHLETTTARRFLNGPGATFELAPKTLYLCRDPRAALANYFAQTSDPATRISEWLRSDACSSPVPHDGPGLSWAQHVRAARRFAATTPRRMLWLPWQSLQDEPASALAAIAEFCDLDASPQAIASAVERYSPTPANANELDADDLAYITSWAGPMMRELGYSITG